MKKAIPNPEKQLAYLAYVNREHEFHHQGYNEETRQLRMVQSGNPEAIEEGQRLMRKTMAVGLSEDPLRNAQYLFVANIALVTRYAIEGGMDSETAFNASDMYIRKLEQCAGEEDVLNLNREMTAFFVSRMAAKRKEIPYSLAISQSIGYIESNLHTSIRLDEVAEHVKLSAGYFSVLFHRETGETFTDYVLRRRIETARNMLRYSDYSSAEISEILAFSSQSYFISCFRKQTGMTPLEYRQQAYARGGGISGKTKPNQDWRAGLI